MLFKTIDHHMGEYSIIQARQLLRKQSDLLQVGGFLLVLLFPSPRKLAATI